MKAPLFRPKFSKNSVFLKIAAVLTGLSLGFALGGALCYPDLVLRTASASGYAKSNAQVLQDRSDADDSAGADLPAPSKENPAATPAPIETSPTPTPTQTPPTPTPTQVPPTPTSTEVPPTPTPTQVPPTSTPTQVPPMPTPTQVPPMPTPTLVPPIPTPTLVPPIPTPTQVLPTPTPSPTSIVSLTGPEKELYDAINARRQQAGLPSLAIRDTLTQVARTRCQDMASRNYFSHTTPEGTNFVDLIMARGFNYGVAAEILGKTNGPDDQSVTLVMNAFLESPAHRPHVLGDKYASMGVGMATGGGGMKYYAVIFWGP